MVPIFCMKNALDTLYFYIKYLFILTPLLISCAKTTAKESELTDEQLASAFFNVVYKSVATRTDSAWPWAPTSGTYEIKFDQSNNLFSFYFTSYSEPQYCLTGAACSCSGTSGGSFEVTESYVGSPEDGATVGQEEEATGGYDPSPPYVPPWKDTGSDSSGASSDASKVANFVFSLSFGGFDLFGCRSQADRSIRVSRFKNGELNVKDDYREIWLKPVIQ